MKLLLTGATGFLGNSILQRINSEPDNKWKDNLVLLGHSEKRADEVRREYNLPVYIGDIKDNYFLDRIFAENDISTIIHTAAIKYVSVSNDNPISTLETNVVGSYNLVKRAKDYGIKEFVGVSTDKAIMPTNVYGNSKRLMEKLFVGNGYTVVSGVNFFGSSGSVLDVWHKQMIQKKPLTLTDKSCIRYFVEVDDMVDLIFESIGKEGIFYPSEVFEIKLESLLRIFMNIFGYIDYEITGLLPGEKLIEDKSDSSNIIKKDNVFLENIIKRWRQETSIVI